MYRHLDCVGDWGMSNQAQCSVRDGLFIDPCRTLAEATDNYMGNMSRKKGITRYELYNMSTGQPTRTYYGIKSSAFANGHLFNVCPFCGTDISAPFMPKGGTV